jgi:hypothetical protein
MPGADVHGGGMVVWNIDELIDALERYGLTVSARAAVELRAFRDHLDDTPDDYSLSAEDALELRRMVTDLRKTIEPEALGNVAYILRDKRYDVNKLLERIWELLDVGVYAWLPDIAKYDFREAGRCIAVESPTAAAFHVIRGTESALREFYCGVVRRNRSALMWGPMVTSLRARVGILHRLNSCNTSTISATRSVTRLSTRTRCTTSKRRRISLHCAPKW